MKTTTAIATLLAAAACVSASSASNPILAFTSKQASSTKLELPTDASYTGLIDSLFAAGKDSPACELGAITVVRANNLDRDTFASLRHSSTNSLRARSLGAPSQVTFNAGSGSIPDSYLEEQREKACGDRGTFRVATVLGHERFVSDKDVPQLLYIDSKDLRKEESSLLKQLESIDEIHPQNLVIIISNSGLHQHVKRQYVAEPFASSGNWTEPEGGIFARYQLFSTPLILTLVLVGGVLLPIVYFAVSQLAQIQTPDQMGVRKDPISGDKKTQ